jgi:hypothetical protein
MKIDLSDLSPHELNTLILDVYSFVTDCMDPSSTTRLLKATFVGAISKIDADLTERQQGSVKTSFSDFFAESINSVRTKTLTLLDNFWNSRKMPHCRCFERRTLPRLRWFLHTMIPHRYKDHLDHHNPPTGCFCCNHRAMASTKRWKTGQSDQREKHPSRRLRH